MLCINEEKRIMCVSDIGSCLPGSWTFIEIEAWVFMENLIWCQLTFLHYCGEKSVVKHFPSCLFTVDFHTSMSFPCPLLIASVSFLFHCFLKEVEVFCFFSQSKKMALFAGDKYSSHTPMQKSQNAHFIVSLTPIPGSNCFSFF